MAAASLAYRPGEAEAVAHALVTGKPGSAIGAEELASLRARIGEGPVRVVLGRPDQAESADSITSAALRLADLPDVSFLPVLRRANVMGALDMGMSPGLLPGRTLLQGARDHLGAGWDNLPSEVGLDTQEILEAATEGEIDVLVLVGADPAVDFGDKGLALAALGAAHTVISLDQFVTASTGLADIVLPVSGFAEVSGTTTNLEGRVSALDQKVSPPGTSRSDWMVAAELALRLDADLGLESVDQITEEIAQVAPSHVGFTPDAMRSSEEGMLAAPGPIGTAGIARDTSDAPEPVETPAGHLRLLVRRSLYDLGTQVTHSPSSAPLIATGRFVMHPTDAQTLGLADGAAVTVTSVKGPMSGQMQVDAGVTPGTVLSWANVEAADGSYLIDIDSYFTSVTVEAAG